MSAKLQKADWTDRDAFIGICRAPCSSAAGPWAAPSTDSRSTARRKSRSRPRAHSPSACARHAAPAGSSAPRSPTRRPSNRSGNAGRCGSQRGDGRVSTRGAPHTGRSSANQAPNKESHLIHSTQQLLGSALSAGSNTLGWTVPVPPAGGTPIPPVLAEELQQQLKGSECHYL